MFALVLLAAIVQAELHCVNDCLEMPDIPLNREMMEMKSKGWADCQNVFGTVDCVNRYQSITGAETPCINGFAGEYPCQNIDMLAFISHRDMTGDPGTRGNDMWGWTDPITGQEIAFVMQTDGTTFVDVSDPVNPQIIGRLRSNVNGHNSWRDGKVFQDHLYVISEAADHGMQVFDLTQLRNRTHASPAELVPLTAQYSEFGSCHNLALNEATGFAYAIGSRTCNGGPHQVDVRNTENPQFAGCFANDGYTHDSECIVYRGPDTRFTGREICFHYNENTLTIVDHSDHSAPVLLSRLSYNGAAYTHQGWIRDDHQYLLLDDEADERAGNTPDGRAANYIWDVRNLTSPIHQGTYFSPVRSIDHNQYFRGQYSFMSNYESGLRVIDISGIAQNNLFEVAFFDVRPQSNDLQFNGVWSSYIYFSSGTIVSNSIERGLFVLNVNIPGIP